MVGLFTQWRHAQLGEIHVVCMYYHTQEKRRMMQTHVDCNVRGNNTHIGQLSGPGAGGATSPFQ